MVSTGCRQSIYLFPCVILVCQLIVGGGAVQSSQCPHVTSQVTAHVDGTVFNNDSSAAKGLSQINNVKNASSLS